MKRNIIAALFIIGLLLVMSTSCGLFEPPKPVRAPEKEKVVAPVLVPVLPAPVVKPIVAAISAKRTGKSVKIMLNKKARDLVAKGYVIHVNVDYMTYHVKEGVNTDLGWTPPNAKRFTVGVFNPATGKYATSARI